MMMKKKKKRGYRGLLRCSVPQTVSQLNYYKDLVGGVRRMHVQVYFVTLTHTARKR
jgi:hypothetical protein